MGSKIGIIGRDGSSHSVMTPLDMNETIIKEINIAKPLRQRKLPITASRLISKMDKVNEKFKSSLYLKSNHISGSNVDSNATISFQNQIHLQKEKVLPRSIIFKFI